MDRVATIRIGQGATAPADVQAAAAAAGTSSVWLLAADAEPADGAFDALAAAARDAIPVSVPVDAQGRPQEDWMGTFADSDAEAVLAGARRRVVPLRFSPLYSLLVLRDVVASEQPPDVVRYGAYADQEWTARLFRHRRGVIAVDSEVRLGRRRLPLEPAALARLTRAPGFRSTDALRIVRLAQRRGV